jgi:DNA-binding NtrC family response regulator
VNILVVDDETALIGSIRIGLAVKGYHVIEAYSAQLALDQLNNGEQRIDLILTDYLMPAMNGIELLAAIRETHPSIPVVIMTAYIESKSLAQTLENPCTGFIEKPFSLTQLLAEIEKFKPCSPQNRAADDLKQQESRLVSPGKGAVTARTDVTAVSPPKKDSGQ